MCRPLALALLGALTLPIVAGADPHVPGPDVPKTDGPASSQAGRPPAETDSVAGSQEKARQAGPASAADGKGESASRADAPRAGTILAGESGWVEFLPEAPPAGTTIRLKEGWIRVESVPDDEEPGGGSFGVISSEVFTSAAPSPEPAREQRQVVQQPVRSPQERPLRANESPTPLYEQEDEVPPPSPKDQRAYAAPTPLQHTPEGALATGACHEEQEAYVRELFRMAGIWDFDHPVALLMALGETPGLSPWIRWNLFGAPFLGPTSGVGVSWTDPVRPIAWDDELRWAAKDLTACVRRQLGFDDRLVDPDTGR